MVVSFVWFRTVPDDTKVRTNSVRYSTFPAKVDTTKPLLALNNLITFQLQ